MGDFFTKADWRPGKHRRRVKRVNHWGGCKVAPIALLAAQHRIGPGRANMRLCTAIKRDGTPCRMIAFREYDVCGAHGGFLKRWQAGTLAVSGKRALFVAERARQAADRAIHAATRELARLPIYQQASNSDRRRLLRAWQSEAWPKIVRAQLAKQKTNTPTVI